MFTKHFPEELLVSGFRINGYIIKTGTHMIIYPHRLFYRTFLSWHLFMCYKIIIPFKENYPVTKTEMQVNHVLIIKRLLTKHNLDPIKVSKEQFLK
jgi:hypothetical protein